MNRAEKAAEIESLKARFAESQLTILTDYKGLNVADMTVLRDKLREKETKLKVVKNRLVKRALKDTDAECLSDYFVGTTAVATTGADPTQAAKVIADFAKENETLTVKAGFLDGQLIDAKKIESLAKMPSKEVLIAKLMGSMQAPATNLANVLAQIPRQLVNVLDAVKKQKETQS